MSTLHELEEQPASLHSAEKAQLLQSVVRDIGDAFPGIESHPNVCGGDACIIRTGIPVWILAELRRQGATDAEILQSYPTLGAQDLANAWAYARSHREEIERQQRENEEAN
jgi:uncharacterized protein (DUF433 family)